MTFSDPSQPIIRAICGAALFVGDLSAEMIDHLFMVRRRWQLLCVYIYSGEKKRKLDNFFESTSPEICPTCAFLSHCKLKVHAFPKFEKKKPYVLYIS